MSNFTTTHGGTILTVPANRMWVGTVSLSASTTATAGDLAVAVHPSVTISGTGAENYANGDTVAAVSLALPAVGAGATTGNAATASLTSGRLIIQARANPISLVLNLPSRTVGSAMATGEMM